MRNTPVAVNCDLVRNDRSRKDGLTSTMTKKIWVISELYYPEETSTGHYLTKIAEGLAGKFPVSVLCGQPSYSARGIRAPAREEYHGVDIQRCRATTFDKNILWLRLINLATISLSIFVNGVRRINRHDYVLVVTNPPLLPFLVAAACWLRGARCLLLIHDVYPEVLIVSGLAKPGALSTRFLGWLNKYLYRIVERIIVLGRDMEAIVAKKLTSDHQRIVRITNWADVEQVVPDERRQNALLKQLGLSDKFVVQYAGNMGRTHGLESLFESVKRLAAVKDVHFLFVGSGAKKRWLEENIKKAHLQNTTILNTKPRSDLSTLLNACDIAMISFIPGMAGISVPSRMYNILAAGKPIIAVTESTSELALVVREEKVGWVVPPNQPDKVVEAVLEARAHPERLADMRARARAAAENKYSLSNVIESYRSMISDLNNHLC